MSDFVPDDAHARLVETWEAWDAHPGNVECVTAMEDANRALADDVGVSPNLLRELCLVLRRGGWSYIDCVEGARRCFDESY